MIAQRNPHSPRVLSVSPLTRDDLQFLQAKSAVPQLSRLRESHKHLVRMLAMGMKQVDIAGQLGLTQSRVSILSRDPLVCQEVAKFSKAIDQQVLEKLDVKMEMLNTATVMAMDLGIREMEEALAGQRDMASRDIRGWAELGLDRIGYGKRSTNVNVNVGFAAMLEKARLRSIAPVIDAEAIPDEAA